MKLNKQLVIALLAIPFLCAIANGQYVNYRVTRATDGVVLVWDSPGNQFTLEVKGNEKDLTAGVLNKQGQLFFKAGEIIMEVQPAMVSDFVKEPEARRLDSLSILKAHRDWEAKYVESVVMGKKLEVKSTPQKLADNRDVLLWDYEVPAGTPFPLKQIEYLTIMNGDKFVLMLTCKLSSKDQAEAARRLLLNTAATIKPTIIPHNGQVLVELKQKPD